MLVVMAGEQSPNRAKAIPTFAAYNVRGPRLQGSRAELRCCDEAAGARIDRC
jgi:hypothetical protein